MSFGKGQGSTEYLVIAAVVLVVALIALGLLGYWPGFGAEAKKTQSDVYWKSANPISIIDYTKQGDVLTLVLFNNDVQGDVTVTSVKLGAYPQNFLQASVKISSNSATKVSLVLPTAENCSSANAPFEYKISFGYKTKDGTVNNQDGVAPLIGQCDSDTAPADLCHMCPAPANELCCEPAFCNPNDVQHECGLCGNGVADEGETCADCAYDVHCTNGQTCNTATGVCESCVATGSYGCTSPANCCSSTAVCDVRGVCVDNSAGTCGDHTCNHGETCSSCPGDCGPCPVICGDSFCNSGAGETCTTCPADCGACASCGDGNCMPPAETCQNCPQDCGPCAPAAPLGTCGNHVHDEPCALCPSDWADMYPSGCPAMLADPAYCGNGICDIGETFESCSQDCYAASSCGPAHPTCDTPYESCSSCPEDCLPCMSPQPNRICGGRGIGCNSADSPQCCIHLFCNGTPGICTCQSSGQACDDDTGISCCSGLVCDGGFCN